MGQYCTFNKELLCRNQQQCDLQMSHSLYLFMAAKWFMFLRDIIFESSFLLEMHNAFILCQMLS
jgi:hypothetical protein